MMSMNGAKCFLGFLLAAASAGANTAIKPAPRDADDGRFGGEAFIKRHEEFLEVARREPCEVVFVGDSITDMWREEERSGVTRGKRVWDKYFVPLRAVNFGIGGDRTQHVLWRIQHGEFDRIKPKNQERLDASTASGRVSVLFEANPKTIRVDAVALDVKGEVRDLKNDYVLVFAGGVLPTAFLEKAGVEVKTMKGEAYAPANR